VAWSISTQCARLGSIPTRGNSQEPRSWTAGRRETEALKPVDKPIRDGERVIGPECGEREVASKVGNSRGRACFRKAKAAWRAAQGLTDAASTLAG